MNTIVIIQSPGRMANKVHVYANVYAYCLHNGYQLVNYDFYDYYKYFNIPTPPRNFFVWCLHRLAINPRYRKLLNFFNNVFFGGRIIILTDNEYFLLPPDTNTVPAQQAVLDMIRTSKGRTFYMGGWLFRSYQGIEVYKKEVIEFFRPKDEYVQQVSEFIRRLKDTYKLVIGVHIRRGDYSIPHEKKVLFEYAQINAILNDLQENLKYTKKETVFVICSDAPIQYENLEGFNFVPSLGTEILDLYVLAETDLIVGSNSTYNAWAAYYGNKLRVIFSKEKINWKESLRDTPFLR